MPTKVISTPLSGISRNNRENSFKGVCLLLILLVLPKAAPAFSEEEHVIWQYPTGGRIVGAPLATDAGAIAFVSEDRYLYTVDRGGTLLWRRDLGYRPGAGIAAGADGSLYIIGRSGAVQAYNPAGGLVWEGDTGGRPVGPPLPAENGTLITCTEGGVLSAWSHNGFLLWRKNLGAAPSSVPILSEDAVLLVPQDNGYLTAFDLYGNELWRFLTAGSPSSPFPAAGGVACGTAYGTVFLLNERGRLVWNISYAGAAEVLFRDSEKLYICTGRKILRCLSTDGKELWSRAVRSESGVEIGGCGDTIILFDSAGLEILGPEGTPLHSLKVPLGSGTYAPGPGKLALHGGENWIVTCLSLPERAACDHPAVFDCGRALNEDTPPSRESVDYRYMKEVAGGDNRTRMEQILRDFELLNANSPPESIPPHTEEILKILAGGAVMHPIYLGKQLMNDFPFVRERAVRLLERYGTLDIWKFLLSLITLEWEPLVRAAIITTLGTLGYDPEGRVTDGIYRILQEEGDNDPRQAAASLDAMERIIRYNGGIPSESAPSLFLSIFRGDYPAELRRRASRLLFNTGK